MTGIKKMPANAYGLFLVRSAMLGVVALLCTVTFWYCTSVYFDQNAALHDVLNCASKVLQESNTTYWLDKGTLLGAARNKKFVVWDGDVTFGAVSNFTGGLYDVMDEVSTKCHLHFQAPPEYARAQAQRAAAAAGRFADTDVVHNVVWYMYNAHVGLKVLEWTPSDPESVVTTATTLGATLSAAVLSHSADMMHSLDTIFPLRPCELHALAVLCPNNEGAILESHYGESWYNATLMSLFH